MDFPPGVSVLQGGNGQGKTNLLEAVSMLAMARSVRAGNDREVIAWAAERDEIPFARISGAVSRVDGPVRLELVVQASRGAGPDDGASLQKRAWVNGVPKRPADVVGEVKAVLFEPQDIELVNGAPSVRRRYLNVMLSQADRAMVRELQRYTRVLTQRNALLKAIRERRAREDELDYWDAGLVESGAFIIGQRAEAMARLHILAAAIHAELTEGEALDVRYEPSVPVPEHGDPAAAFQQAMEALRDRETAAGMSLAGPHRDDVRFLSNDRDMGVYASRGQQRTASLALKLAEARFLAERGGDPPVLLLDDVFSELDGRRQGYVLDWIAGWEQALVTTAEPERLRGAGLPNVARFEVRAGRVIPSPC
jgi:DNA replication and repair protein RecF